MRLPLRRYPFAIVLLAVIPGLAASTVQTRQNSPRTHGGSISDVRVTETDSGRAVVVFTASGGLRGMVTLSLDVAQDGSVTGGDWALVSTYVQDLNADGSEAEPDPHSGEGSYAQDSEPHEEFIRIVDKGTLSGQVLGGFVGDGSNGASALVGIQLQLTAGTLSFGSVSTGTGTVDVDLGSPETQGTLRLAF